MGWCSHFLSVLVLLLMAVSGVVPFHANLGDVSVNGCCRALRWMFVCERIQPHDDKSEIVDDAEGNRRQLQFILHFAVHRVLNVVHVRC